MYNKMMMTIMTIHMMETGENEREREREKKRHYRGSLYTQKHGKGKPMGESSNNGKNRVMLVGACVVAIIMECNAGQTTDWYLA